MQFIRVLYNEHFEENRPKILRDLRRSFSDRHNSPRAQEFIRDRMVYYTMGPEATKLLKGYGAKNVFQIVDKPILRMSGGVLSWNKIYLIRAAVHDYGEVLYTDFDIYMNRAFSPQEVAATIRSHGGLGRIFQMPLISYKKRYFWFRSRSGTGHDRISPTTGLFGCFIYVTSEQLLDCFFEDYEELIAGGKMAGDEQFITYSIDKRFGEMTVRQMYDNFAPVVIRSRCDHPGRSFGMDKIVFSHKRK